MNFTRVEKWTCNTTGGAASIQKTTREHKPWMAIFVPHDPNKKVVVSHHHDWDDAESALRRAAGFKSMLDLDDAVTYYVDMVRRSGLEDFEFSGDLVQEAIDKVEEAKLRVLIDDDEMSAYLHDLTEMLVALRDAYRHNIPVASCAS